MVTARPPATLKQRKAPPAPCCGGGLARAAREAATTSRTWTKSRVCSPSPWMVGAVPLRRQSMKREITPE